MKTYINLAGALVLLPVLALAQTVSLTSSSALPTVQVISATVSPAANTISANASSSCPFNVSFMKAGVANNSADVAKLQNFLKDHEGADVNVSGTFDDKTDSAVKAFQEKYLSDIMGPWNATRASGIVRFTTVKKINQILCNVPLSLSAQELAAIQEYKTTAMSGTAPIASVNQPSSNPSPNQSSPTMAPETSPSSISPSPIDSNTPSPMVSNNEGDQNAATSGPFAADMTQGTDQSSSTAAVGNTSVARRFWDFLKALF